MYGLTMVAGLFGCLQGLHSAYVRKMFLLRCFPDGEYRVGPPAERCTVGFRGLVLHERNFLLHRHARALGCNIEDVRR